MARRKLWMFITTGVLAILGVLGLAGWAYWGYANALPAYTPPKVAMPVPNAYDDYVRAGALCKAAGGSAVSPAGDVRDRRGYTLQGFEDEASLEQERGVVARNRPALARLRQGFRKTYRNPPVTSFRQGFPQLASYRELARVLVTEGKLAEREGRMPDAARSYLDCVRMGVDLKRGGVLIHGLVAIAIEAIGLKALEGAVDHLDGLTAAAAAREMVRLDQGAPTFADTLTWEKESSTAMLMETLREGPVWRHVLRNTQALHPTWDVKAAVETASELAHSLTPKRLILSNYRTYMDAVIADARKPSWVRVSEPPVPSDPLSQMMVVGIGTRSAWNRSDTMWRNVELRLAERAYRLQHGRPPPSAAALVPGYLPAVPRNPITGKPLTIDRP